MLQLKRLKQHECTSGYKNWLKKELVYFRPWWCYPTPSKGGMGAWRNSTETQQSGYAPRSGPEVKNGSSTKNSCTAPPQRDGAFSAPLFERWAEMTRQLPRGAQPSSRPKSSENFRPLSTSTQKSVFKYSSTVLEYSSCS